MLLGNKVFFIVIIDNTPLLVSYEVTFVKILAEIFHVIAGLQDIYNHSGNDSNCNKIIPYNADKKIKFYEFKFMKSDDVEVMTQCLYLHWISWSSDVLLCAWSSSLQHFEIISTWLQSDSMFTYSKLISPSGRIYVSVNWVSIGSDNGLLPAWHQAITWTNAHLLSIGPLEKNFNEIWTKIQSF